MGAYLIPVLLGPLLFVLSECYAQFALRDTSPPRVAEGKEVHRSRRRNKRRLLFPRRMSLWAGSPRRTKERRGETKRLAFAAAPATGLAQAGLFADTLPAGLELYGWTAEEGAWLRRRRL